MNSLVALLSPLALVLPAVAAGWPGEAPTMREEVARASPEEESAPALGFDNPALEPLRVLEQARREPIENQVRIEQRVIVRIAPSSRQRFERALSELDRNADRLEEVRYDDCLPINMIAGVRPEDNRLLLFMHDRRLFSATLERACNPRDFYSGFYVERNDGRLCKRRDRLQSRTGASCQVTRLNRLVAARD